MECLSMVRCRLTFHQFVFEGFPYLEARLDACHVQSVVVSCFQTALCGKVSLEPDKFSSRRTVCIEHDVWKTRHGAVVVRHPLFYRLVVAGVESICTQVVEHGL